MDEGYELAPDPVAPALPGVVVMRPNSDAVVDALLAELLVHALRCVRLYGDVHIGLSAESDLDPVYRRLMYDPPMRSFPWEQAYVWVTEEPDPPASPTRAATLRAWFEHHSGIPQGRIRGPFDTADPAEYEASLASALGPRGEHEDRLDVVVLGTTQRGPKGSPDPALHAPGTGTAGLSLHAVNRARFVAIYAGGPGARPALNALTRGEAHPLSGIRPDPGQLRWFVDHEACGPA
jgi:hypothetical protein